MRLEPGTRLGGYEVLDGIGAGGMGEVYRARDPVLQRDVAIKIVRPDVCHHPDSLARLRREARALAALNHPHVATLHELAEFGGTCGLVMELVDGDTLAELLSRRRLSIDEIIRLGAQIASALEAAHDRGLVHRDLKPANIKVTTESTIKVLDFGLARTETDTPDAGASTLITSPGAVVGTVAYMSPEQARGAPVDRRTDLWALGCVLYEMLSGRRPFDGPSHSDVVAAVLDKEPDWSALPADAPRALQRLIRRCLQKDVRRRLRDAGDARLELEDAHEPLVAGPPLPRRHASVSWLAMVGVLIAGVALGTGASLMWRPAPAIDVSEIRFSMSLPDDERLAQSELGALAMSPDGRSIVYVASRGNTTQLLLRRLDAATSTPLPGTVAAISPFFSPDGEWIAFFADGKLKKVPVRGGSVVTIADAADGLGGSWGNDGTIVFAAATGSGLQRVSAEGGAVSRASTLDVSRGEFSHRWPEFLPDGDTVLFTVGTVGEWDAAEIAAQSLRSGQRTSILKGGTNPRFVASGHLAYAHDGAIWAAAFDANRLTVSGPPTRVLEGVATSADGAAQFAVSPSGTTVYHPNVPSSSRRLVIVDDRAQTPLAAPPHAYVTARVSPDGRRVLLGVSDEAEHVWSYDLNTGRLTQLTFEAANRSPIWSPDGQRVTFASNRNGALNLFTAPASADGPAERLTTADSLQLPGSWSADGEVLAFMEQNPTTGRDVWLMRRDGDRTAFANTTADESAPRFSPDGRWIAYVSTESGPPFVYVRAANGATAARKLSVSSGSEPVWRPDGTAVYFRSEGRLLVAPLNGGATRVAFEGAFEPGTFDAAGYDVIGGNRFVMIISASASSEPSELRIVLNWTPTVTSSR
jgi:eukaryotic-like serine/threonine-protein kinase